MLSLVVETQKIAGSGNLASGQALDVMKKLRQLDRHPSMINAICNFYGYSSAISVARHAMHDDERNITFSEARFFLVVCLAFVNYLIAKSADMNDDALVKTLRQFAGENSA